MLDDSLAEAGEHRERIWGLFGEQRARRKPVIEKGNGMKAIVRLGAAVAMAAALVAGFAGTASAERSSHLEVHVRACPVDVVNWFEDCHDNPVEGYVLTGEPMTPEECTTDASGNCVWDDNETWYYIYTNDDIAYYYCSIDDPEATWQIIENENLISIDDLNEVPTTIVCDIYIIDETLPLAHGGDAGAGLPNTGAGVSGQGANLGLLLAGVVALGGLAVASRRAAVR